MAGSRVFRSAFVGVLGLAAVAGACRATRGSCETVPDSTVGASANGDAGAVAPPPRPPLDGETATGRLVAFEDDAELRAYREAWQKNEDAKRKRRVHPMNGPAPDAGLPPALTAAASAAPQAAAATPPSPPPPRAAAHAAADTKAATESITNNQHANVDEGDIVKLHGDHLVVLRRGRLFTISLAGDRMRTSKMLDAFGPDIDPSGSWYDEMLVEGDNVVVVGFSYARGGTEIGLFKIDAAGGLAYRATYHLRSNDYYSARNYASRIVDGRLVFYAPMYISPGSDDLAARLPAVRRWRRGAKDADFVRTLAATRLYRMAGELPSTSYAALHTVTSCDLSAQDIACESVGLIGPAGRVFYVSPSNVYVWMRDWAYGQNVQSPAMLAKIPITRKQSAVTAMRVSGMPTDQFSFEEGDDGFLNVLVRSESNGDAMFASESTAGAAALLRVPLSLFSDGVPTASARRYRQLPRPDGYAVQNRFVGPWLLYGSGNGYVTNHRGGGQLYAVRYAKEDAPVTIRLEQGVDRIEPMGSDAVVVGSAGTDLVFSPIELGAEARAHDGYVRKNASQGELRSHGFFYKPTSTNGTEGIVGLPIRSDGARGARYLLDGSASVLFLKNDSRRLSELGQLRASELRTNHDGCRASCVDWYGNARPIFAKNRVFALMGYELVEGRLDERGLGERGRLSFAPRGGPPAEEW
jgi:hypothetical protein